jgi:glutaconate CoA-transferase, subunit A
VQADALRSHPEHNQIPAIIVDAVVPVPYGAYPTACYRYYDYDPTFLSDYRTAATDDERYASYLDRWVHGKKDHAERLAEVGNERLTALKADLRTGYATGLRR